MTRFRRKNSRKNSKPLQTAGLRFWTSSFEPPSSEEPSWLRSPVSTSGSSSKSLLGPFALWSNRSASSVADENHWSVRPRQILTADLQHPRFASTNPDCPADSATKPPRATRLPRHVPIIIPDFAQPFQREIRPCASESDINNHRYSAASTIKALTYEAVLSPTLSNAVSVPRTATGSENKKELSLVARQEDLAMNNSQVSLTASDVSAEAPNGSTQTNNGTGNNGTAPGVSQQGTAPTNLSGLVCNVHRTTGEEPHALVGATTTILGDKLYVFGGRVHSRTKPQLTADLYELDLIHRHWAKIEAVGDIPPPRYFHSVCALGDSKLVCYGGMSPATHKNISNPQSGKGAVEPQPEVVVMSDIHIFDVPTRKWTLISTSENPQGRYAHCAAVLPSSAVFTSANAPLSAIQHNPPSSDPHSGTLGVQLDGSGGAEMIVVGGQDSSNNYIEQISVFNLRSLKWTNTTSWDRKCGAYKSMVAPMTGLSAELVGRGVPLNDPEALKMTKRPGTSMLIYSNYNFLDVKLELQIRLPDGSLVEKPMSGNVSPPGLRFPNGGIIDGNFVVSGTYLTSSKHEYALWALDLKTLTWARIDTNGSIFSQGSWNRGILWNRRNTFVILGHRKRSLVDDYNHRRINFTHVCMVELEAFGLYDNPRTEAPTSSYVSVSAPVVPTSLRSNLPTQLAGGRPYSIKAEQLGQAALSLTELSDMEIVALGGEKIPCNSFILSRRWGPFFNQLLAEYGTTHDNGSISDGATLRPADRSQASRNSSLTITPSAANGFGGPGSTAGSTAVGSGPDGILDPQRSLSRSTTRTLVELPNPTSVPASNRPRSLYLPHMAQTIHLLLHFLYTSSLPPVGYPLCTPHTLCSLLQMARPYQIDGLLEATVERLHEALDGRNSAAVFNAAAMAAGGGRGLVGAVGAGLSSMGRRESEATTVGEQTLTIKTAGLKLTTSYEEPSMGGGGKWKGHGKSSSTDTTSTSTSTDVSHTDPEVSPLDETVGGRRGSRQQGGDNNRESREMWTGDVSSVIGLQKRGLRGLMEGRRLRERANTGATGVEGM
ncbi:hypothetical protein PV08_01320 [Exophiala spinifera]|uniref:BTB domain-containing protein n=1 Tax=Exophiala spinifera TaxID=91928 RepID=A0A0D2A7I7_9EURO|nr:uncharacterized protein PV08_01320 [Exophiala spinifera]KIW20742.1 hypothetical protein PV08_01320 [Exophiala spinifera]